MQNRYDIRVEPTSFEEIKSQWQALEAATETNIFLSWLWVEIWLKTYKPKVELLVVRYSGVVVGLALLGRTEERRHKVLRSRVIRFGRTGKLKEDQIWPEYAGLLLAEEHASSAAAQILERLLVDPSWDEIELAAMSERRLSGFVSPCLNIIETWSAPAFGVDLRDLKSSGKEFLTSLSRNTRYQINRCKKRYLQLGDLHFQVLTTAEEIREAWPIMAELHRARWDHTTEKSGFSNPSFVAFHEQLIEQGCEQGTVHFCVLRLGEKFVGGLYNLVYRRRVYFYLSSLVQEKEAYLKPGLLLHSYAIAYYLDADYDYYDFMGGDSQYKRSLGSQHCELKTVYLQRGRSKLKIEQGLKKLKGLLSEAKLKGAGVLKRTGWKK